MDDGACGVRRVRELSATPVLTRLSWLAGRLESGRRAGEAIRAHEKAPAGSHRGEASGALSKMVACALPRISSGRPFRIARGLAPFRVRIPARIAMRYWLRGSDSNRRHRPYEDLDLPLSYRAFFKSVDARECHRRILPWLAASRHNALTDAQDGIRPTACPSTPQAESPRTCDRAP
jgi:hypothetical protein